MAPKSITRGMKRVLEQCAVDSYDIKRRSQQRTTKCDRASSGEDKCDQVSSRRYKRMSHVEFGQASNQYQNVIAPEHCERQSMDGNEIDSPAVDEHRFMISEGRCSHSAGQAAYQRSKQGLIVRYEDSGDNSYSCNHCGACFWFGEAIKRSSSNAAIIYTNCCKKGEIKFQNPKPTPTFLENLLNPNNGSESKLFRENIRVYNSMFSFTSMGAAIDYKINNGSGSYVFKIGGQVHHLMGSS